MEEITSIIANNLKGIRKERQMTLEGLSQVTGVSVSMLGEIERGVTNPTITILWKIADGLKISLGELIKPDEAPVSVVYHKDAGASLDGPGFRIFSVYEFDPAKKNEFLYKILEPGANMESSGHRVGMEEYILICDGVLMLQVGENQYSLQRGDAIRFDGHIHHRYQNLREKPVTFFMIFFYGVS